MPDLPAAAVEDILCKNEGDSAPMADSIRGVRAA